MAKQLPLPGVFETVPERDVNPDDVLNMSAEKRRKLAAQIKRALEEKDPGHAVQVIEHSTGHMSVTITDKGMMERETNKES